MTNDPNWNKTGIYYLVIGHACDEEQYSHLMFFNDEQPTEYIEKKFTNFVLKELGLLFEKEVYIDFILKSTSPIQLEHRSF